MTEKQTSEIMRCCKEDAERIIECIYGDARHIRGGRLKEDAVEKITDVVEPEDESSEMDLQGQAGMQWNIK